MRIKISGKHHALHEEELSVLCLHCMHCFTHHASRARRKKRIKILLPINPYLVVITVHYNSVRHYITNSSSLLHFILLHLLQRLQSWFYIAHPEDDYYSNTILYQLTHCF